MPGGDGTHRETTIDRLSFGADGLMQKVVPTLESIDPLAYEGSEPTASVSDAGSDGWYGADAALTLTADDTVETVQYRIGTGEWTAYTAPVPLPAGLVRRPLPRPGTNLQWSDEQILPVKIDATLPEVEGCAGPAPGDADGERH